MRLEQFLEYAGTEVANVNRTLTYVRDLGDPRIVASVDACDCASIDTGPFATPQADPAPWYDGSAASAAFLGFLLDLNLTPPGGRSSEDRGIGGATIGPYVRKGRILQASGLMFAASAVGMKYGEEWLERILAGTEAGCADDDMRLLPVCPGLLRTGNRVGLVDGPLFAPAGSIPECIVQTVAFQLQAGSPFFLSDQTVALAQQQLTGDKSVCFTSEIHTAVIVTVIAGPTAIAGVDVYFEPCAGYSDTYTSDVYDPPKPTGSQTYAEFEITSLAADHTLIVNSADRTVRVEDASGRLVGGFDALTWRNAWRWMEAFNTAQAECHVDATGATVNAATRVRIETVEII